MQRNAPSHIEHIRQHFSDCNVRLFADLRVPANMTTLTWKDEKDITSLLEDGVSTFNVMLVENKYVDQLRQEIEYTLLTQSEHWQDPWSAYIGVWHAPQSEHALLVVANSWDSLGVPLDQSFNFLDTECHWILAHSTETSVDDFLFQLETLLQTEDVSNDIFDLFAHNYVYQDSDALQTLDRIMNNWGRASSSKHVLPKFNQWRANTERTNIHQAITHDQPSSSKRKI